MSRTDQIMHLLQLADSAMPSGGFSFSCGLESAVEHGLVTNAHELEEFVQTIGEQTAFGDGVAAIAAYRACAEPDYAGIVLSDRRVFATKASEEARRMTTRMGRKTAELFDGIFEDAILSAWCRDIVDGHCHGCYPITQAIVAAATKVSEAELFCAHHYGTVSIIVNAAMRCMRLSHIDAQRILFREGRRAEGLYAIVRSLSIDDMHTFLPQQEILASLHEKGERRLFMS